MCKSSTPTLPFHTIKTRCLPLVDTALKNTRNQKNKFVIWLIEKNILLVLEKGVLK